MINYSLTQKDFRIVARQQLLKKHKVPLILFGIVFIVGLFFLVVSLLHEDNDILITSIVAVAASTVIFVLSITRYIQICRAYAKFGEIQYEVVYNPAEVVIKNLTKSSENTYEIIKMQSTVLKNYVVFSLPDSKSLIVPKNEATKDFLSLFNIQ